MKQALAFLLLLLHFALAGVGMYYVGDFISQDVNILIIMGLGLVYSFIMISLIYHVYQFLLLLTKNKKTQL